MERWVSSLLVVVGLSSIGMLGPVRFAAGDDGDSVAFTDMDQMVFDARQAVRQGRYDVAIHTCEQIIQKDPKNMTALKIMGSAYALLDEPDRSRHVFEYALQIDPNDSEIPKFLAKLPDPSNH